MPRALKPEPTASLADLIKKHGKFTKVVEKTDWFDPEAKPRKKKAESDFHPDPDVKDADDGNI